MRKSTFKLILCSLLTVFIGFGSIYAQSKKKSANILANQFSSENEGTLSFFIRDAENGYGIKSEIQITGNGTIYKLESDDGGHIFFNNKEGRYDITFESKDHSSLTTYFYIENGKTVNIQSHLDRINRTPVQDENLSGALIEGFVIDLVSGKPLKDVSVSMPGQEITLSDENGHFSIFSTEYSKINSTEDKAVRKSITFSAPGYSSYLVNDLFLAPTKISLNITLQKGQGQEQENYIQHILDGTQVDLDMYEQNNSLTNTESQNKSNNSVSTASGCTIPTTIRVGTNCTCTNCSAVSVMSVQSYTEKGIDNEWISSWQSNSLSAGSVAYRSYGAWYVNHPVKSNFDIASTTCNQVWGASLYANCQAAAQATAGMVLTTDGVNPARSEYSAENNGQGAASGISCGNCYSGTGGTYPCFSDNLCCGKARAGHGRGMCQWGTQRWALNGQNFSWIISHYYTIGNITVCGAAPSCGIPSGLSSGSIDSVGSTLSWSAVVGATSYNVQYKATSSSTWITISSGTTSKIITGLTPGTSYQFQVQAVCTSTGSYSGVSTFTTTSSLPSCGTPSGLTVNSVTTNSAILNWTAISGATSYNVKYKETSSSAWSATTSATTSKSITGLLASTTYQFQVQAICSNTGSYSLSTSFSTQAVSATTTTITIGNGTSAYSAHPFGTVYMDERTQYIITKAELTDAGWSPSTSNLKSIAFNVLTAASQPMGSFTISIAHISASSFSSTTFLSGSNNTTVYSGTVAAVSGWNTYNFTTPFAYNGTGNLLVSICWNNSSFTTNSSVQSFSYSNYVALYYRADLASSGVCAKTTGTLSYYRPNAKLIFSTSPSLITVEGGTDQDRSLEEGESISISNDSKVEIFPNPFDGTILYGKVSDNEVSSSPEEASTNMAVSIYDVLGRAVFVKEIPVAEGKFTVPLSDNILQSGIYVFVGILHNNRYSKTIIVK